MTQRRNLEQPFDEKLYGMFMEVFRLTGTMPSMIAQEKIRKICTEIRNEFIKAGNGTEEKVSSLVAIKPVIQKLEDQIAELRKEIQLLKQPKPSGPQTLELQP